MSSVRFEARPPPQRKGNVLLGVGGGLLSTLVLYWRGADGVAALAVGAGFGLFCFLYYTRVRALGALRALTFDADGLVVERGTGRQAVRWADVEGVSMPEQGADGWTFVLKDGTQVGAIRLDAFAEADAPEVARRLREGVLAWAESEEDAAAA